MGNQPSHPIPTRTITPDSGVMAPLRHSNHPGLSTSLLGGLSWDLFLLKKSGFNTKSNKNDGF